MQTYLILTAIVILLAIFARPNRESGCGCGLFALILVVALMAGAGGGIPVGQFDVSDGLAGLALFAVTYFGIMGRVIGEATHVIPKTLFQGQKEQPGPVNVAVGAFFLAPVAFSGFMLAWPRPDEHLRFTTSAAFLCYSCGFFVEVAMTVVRNRLAAKTTAAGGSTNEGPGAGDKPE